MYKPSLKHINQRKYQDGFGINSSATTLKAG